MASGSFNIKTSNIYISGNLTFESAPNIENNTSVVTAKLYLSRTNTGYETYGSGSFNISIGDNSKSESSVYSFTYNSNTLCISHTAEIPHNADGTKTVNIKVSGFVYAGNPNLSVSEQSFSAVLDTIARESDFTVSDGVFGVNQTVKIKSASDNFTHTLEYTCLGETNTLYNKTTAKDLILNIPISLVNKLTNSYYTHCIVKLSTYSGNSLIGTKTRNITVFVPDTSEFYPSIENVLASVITDYSGFSFVKNKSKVKISVVGAKGAYGSSISSYSISGHALSSSKSEDISGTLTQSGNITYTASVKDTRGRTATKSVTINVSDYFLPKIESVTAFRCDANGNIKNDGNYAKVTAKFSCASVNSKNSITPKISYLNKTENISNNTAKIIGTFSLENSYPIKIEVSDLLGGYDSYTASLPTADAILSVTSTGKGVAIGKYAEKDGVLEIAYDLDFKNPQQARENLQITPENIGALSTSGGTVNGNIRTSGNAETSVGANFNGGSVYLFGNNSTGNHGLYDTVKGYIINLNSTTPQFNGNASTASSVSGIDTNNFRALQNNGSSLLETVKSTLENNKAKMLAARLNYGPEAGMIGLYTDYSTGLAWAVAGEYTGLYHITGYYGDWQQNTIYTSRHFAWKKASVAFSNSIGTMSASGVTTSSTVLAIRGDSNLSGSYYSIGAADCNSNGTIKLAQANGSGTNATWTVSAWWSK